MIRLSFGLAIVSSSWLLMLAVMGLLAYELWSSDTVFADCISCTHGPLTRDDLNDGNGTSHWSKVTYDKINSPLLHVVDKVRYGGRYEEIYWPYTYGQWRRNKTQHQEKISGSWVTAVQWSASSWHFGSSSSLTYYDVTPDVYLYGGARVRNQLKYRRWDDYTGWWWWYNTGGWNQHTLP